MLCGDDGSNPSGATMSAKAIGWTVRENRSPLFYLRRQNNKLNTYMKTKFLALNGVEVEGIVLYTSPITRASNSFVNKVYDEIIYAQNRLVKLHHTLKLDDEDNYQEFNGPEVEIINEYVVIPELD